MARIKCYFLEPTNFYRKTVRRYSYRQSEEILCPNRQPWVHDAELLIADKFESLEQLSSGHTAEIDQLTFPTKCDHCDYLFAPEDERTVNNKIYYKRSDNGELVTMHDAPPGAMWYCPWYEGFYRSQDSDPKNVLVVKTPGGDWVIDSRASNCTRKDDNIHFCWIRTGDPRTGNITVHKNGNTCSAGAGSILQDSYHAMLQDGWLIDC